MIEMIELIGWCSPKKIRPARNSVNDNAQIEDSEKDGGDEGVQSQFERPDICMATIVSGIGRCHCVGKAWYDARKAPVPSSLMFSVVRSRVIARSGTAPGRDWHAFAYRPLQTPTVS